MKDNFDACITFVLASEGGYVNDPHDPGGETNFGISKRSYPNVDIKHLTREAAVAIYKKDYWDRVKGDLLPVGVDLVALDAAVNSGVTTSIKWLQAASYMLEDGVLGPKTLSALQTLDPSMVVESALHKRLLYLHNLKTWPLYGKGWMNRLNSLHTLALSMIKKKK